METQMMHRLTQVTPGSSAAGATFSRRLLLRVLNFTTVLCRRSAIRMTWEDPAFAKVRRPP